MRRSRLQVLLDQRPDPLVRRIGDQHLDDGALLHGFFDFEQVDAGFPAVLDRPVPVLRELLGLADDDIEAVVLQVQALPGTLDAVADDGDSLVLQDLPGFLHRELIPHDDFFFDSAEIN